MRSMFTLAGVLLLTAAPLEAQLSTHSDSASVASALAGYIATAPVPISGHGPMTHFVVDTSKGAWNRILGPAAQLAAPKLWLDQRDQAAPYVARIDVRSARVSGDTVTVSAVWTWCYSESGGESGAPFEYTIVLGSGRWSVVSAQTALIAHGRQCSFGRAGAR